MDRRRSPSGPPPGAVVVRLGSQWTPGVKLLLGLFTATCILGQVPGTAEFLRAHLTLVPSQALGPKPWQLLTGPWLLLGPTPLHGLLQLLFLGLLLYSVGSAVEQRIGTKRFLRLAVLASMAAALCAAAAGRAFASVRDLPVHLDGEPVFLMVLGAFAQLYGGERMSFWGLGQPVSGRALSYFFIILTLGFHFIRGLWLDLAAGLTASALGLSLGPGGLRGLGLRVRKRLKDWQLRRARRRYKVIDGGLLTPPERKKRDQRWVN